MERGVRKPFVSRELAVKLAENLFDVQNIVVVREFNCFSDRAFHIKGYYSCSSQDNTVEPNVSEFVLKILNSSDSKNTDFIDGENETIRFLQLHEFPCPTVFCPRGNGDNDLKVLVKLPISESAQPSDVENQNLRQYDDCVVRLMSFLPGEPLSTICSSTASLFTVGQFVGSASRTLQGFSHPSILSRESRWDLKNFLELETYLDAIVCSTQKELARAVLDQFAAQVVLKFSSLRVGTVHNDMSDDNILGVVEDDDEIPRMGLGKSFHITGLIDFGDLVHTFVISEIAISMAYYMKEEDLLESSGYLLAGYQSRFPLPSHEFELLYYFVSAWLCTVAVISGDQYRLFSTNESLAATNWRRLEQFWQIPKPQVDETWRDAILRYSGHQEGEAHA